VARAHGGDVRATPRDGGGLVVTVTLPEAAVAD
jgi:signal transduction histidine kinase